MCLHHILRITTYILKLIFETKKRRLFQSDYHVTSNCLPHVFDLSQLQIDKLTTYEPKICSHSLNLQTNNGYSNTFFVHFQTNLIIFKVKTKYTFVIITR